jgi:acylglycerol lipase
MESKVIKTSDGTDIYIAKNAVGDAGGVLVIVHGLAEHSGRYDYATRKFNEDRISVYRFDHRAHGRSGGTRGDNDDLTKFLADTDSVVNMAIEENPGKPVFMLGHSMGGLIAAAYGTRHGEKLKGQILSGAAVDFLPLFGELRETYTEAMGSEILPNALASAVCRDPEVVKAYEEDPLVLKGVTFRLLYTTFIKGMEQLHQRIDHYRIPCLILHGGNDLLVPSSASRWFYDHVASQDKTVKIYPDCYHEILNEKEEKDQVIADILAWIGNHR